MDGRDKSKQKPTRRFAKQMKALRFFVRQPIFVFCGIICLLVGIVYGVHHTLESRINELITDRSEQSAFGWAKVFAGKLPNIEKLIELGIASEKQEEIIDFAIASSDAFRVTIYDNEGELVYVSDIVRFRIERGYNVSETAYEVADSGKAVIELKRGTERDSFPEQYAEAFVPITVDGSDPIGVVKVQIDVTATEMLLWDKFRPIVFFIPVICALLYLVPAIAFFLKARQSYRQAMRVRELSSHDTLTGVFNRNKFNTILQRRVAEKSDNAFGAVLYIDVDRFKDINDQYGHEFGDNFLAHVANMLSAETEGKGFVGRLGGDEFVIAKSDATDRCVEKLTSKLHEAIRKPFNYRGQTVVGSISIGAYCSKQKESAEEILHKADLALYQAKRNGRNRTEHYSEDLEVHQTRRRHVEEQLRRALEEDLFYPVFQPYFDHGKERTIGFEALLRLGGEEGKDITPGEFIPIAEETGLICDIGMIVLRKAIMRAQTWPEDVIVSVNVSGMQFIHDDIVHEVKSLLEEYDFPGSRLELEVTESVLLSDDAKVAAQLDGLRALGIEIAMDDFGTGFSSLAHLWKYPFDKLKIDRNFLINYNDNKSEQRDIIETIVLLGHKMGMKVTAEGVEDESHVELLQSVQCDYYQGFLYGKPMSGDKATELVQDQKIKMLQDLSSQENRVSPERKKA